MSDRNKHSNSLLEWLRKTPNRKLMWIGWFILVGSFAIYILNVLLSNHQWGQPFIGYLLGAGIIVGTVMAYMFRDW